MSGLNYRKLKKYLRQAYYDMNGHGPVPNNISSGKNNTFPSRYSIDNQAEPDAVVLGDNNTFLDEFHIRNYKKGHIQIGSFNWVSKRLQIVSANSVTIGDYCMIARDVFICDTDEHPVDPELRLQYSKKYLKYKEPPERYDGIANSPIIIGNNVWLCERVMVLKGVTIGNNCVIAAGSLVVRNIPDNSVAAGYPAMVTKKLN